jgi:hypothetical protein
MEKLWGKPKNNMDFITGGKKSKSNLEKIWGTPSKKNPHPLRFGVISLYRKERLSENQSLTLNGIIEKRYGESLKNLSSKIPKGVYVLKIEAFSF